MSDHISRRIITHMARAAREREDARCMSRAEGDPIVLGAPMPAWCLGVIVGAPICASLLWFAGAFG